MTNRHGENLKPFIGRQLRVVYLESGQLNINGKLQKVTTEFQTTGILRTLGSDLAIFDHLREPNETYSGFSISLDQIVSFTPAD